MSDEIAELRKEFASLVSEGKAFLKEVRRDVITNDITTVDIGFEWSWKCFPMNSGRRPLTFGIASAASWRAWQLRFRDHRCSTSKTSENSFALGAQ